MVESTQNKIETAKTIIEEIFKNKSTAKPIVDKYVKSK
jgi:hypothetical protein